MSKKDPKLEKLLQKLNLEKYYVKFLEEETMFCDLQELTENELEEIIPKRIHRKRLFKFFESSKEEKEKKREKEKSPKIEYEKEEKKGEVQMLVKFGNDVKKVYEVPLGTNEELIGKLVQAFLECELKLHDKTVLTKEQRNLTLEKWLEKTGVSPESEIRGVLSVKGAVGTSSEELEESKQKVAELEAKLEEVEKERDANAAELKEMKRLSTLKTEQEVMVKKKKKVVKKKEAVVKKRPVVKTKAMEEVRVRESEVESSSSSTGFKAFRGILVPQNTRFLVNPKCRAHCEKAFSKGNTLAIARGDTIFKASTVFNKGKRYYYQVVMHIEYGWNMGLGLVNGELTYGTVGGHEKGWEYIIWPGRKELLQNSEVTNSKYGPERKQGENCTVGIYCDFTEGKGEVSFIVDGKNWGVAWDDVQPPVSPAFRFINFGDSFQIDQVSELPDCL